MATVKCVLLGDSGCGKTTLFQSYVALSKGKDLAGLADPDKTEVPESSSTYAVMKLVKENMYFLSLFNTSGQEDSETAMKVFYPSTAVFVVCFSVADKSTLQSVKEKWLPAIKEGCSEAPFILVGTKTDLRDDSEKSVTKEEGVAAADEMGAFQYMECCATTQDGVDPLFDKALEAGIPRAAADATAEGATLASSGDAAAAAAAVPKPHAPKATRKEAMKEEKEKEKAKEEEGEGDEVQKEEDVAVIQPETVETTPAAAAEETKDAEEGDKKKNGKDKKDKKAKKKGCTIL